MNGDLTLRKNVRNLSGGELTTLRDAYRKMMGIRDNRGYNHIAGFHGAPGWYCWHHQESRRTPQRARLFLPWHRAYLYAFEQAAQDQVPRATIPWWDWTSNQSHQEGIPRAFSLRTLNRRPNPLYKARIYVPTANPPINRDTRRFPGDPSRLPDRKVLDDLLSLSDWEDFSNQLQNPHDFIHGWTGGRGGDMGSVVAAAFDPIFWSHHCMVDRIWWLWQLRHGNSGIPPSLLDMVLPPFNQRVKDVLNIHELGYEYAGAEVFVEAGG